jgi:hypothetical protein
MASLNIAELPVIIAATNFVTAINPFPVNAVITTFLEPPVDIVYTTL